MVTLWQELDLSSDQNWECKNDSAIQDKAGKLENVGLNRELNDARGRVLGLRPLPSTREVFSEVRREDRRRSIMLKETIEEDGYGLISRGSIGPECHSMLRRPPIVHGFSNYRGPIGSEFMSYMSHGRQIGSQNVPGQNQQKKAPLCHHCCKT